MIATCACDDADLHHNGKISICSHKTSLSTYGPTSDLSQDSTCNALCLNGGFQNDTPS